MIDLRERMWHDVLAVCAPDVPNALYRKWDRRLSVDMDQANSIMLGMREAVSD